MAERYLKDRMDRAQSICGITSEDLANELNVTGAIITRIKKNEEVDSVHLCTIATVLDVPVDYLAGGSYKPRKPRHKVITKRSELSRHIDKLIKAGLLSPGDQNLLHSFASSLAEKRENE